MKSIRLFCLILVLMFVVDGFKKKGFASPLHAGALPILAGEMRPKPTLGTGLSTLASELYSSNPCPRSAQRRLS